MCCAWRYEHNLPTVLFRFDSLNTYSEASSCAHRMDLLNIRLEALLFARWNKKCPQKNITWLFCCLSPNVLPNTVVTRRYFLIQQWSWHSSTRMCFEPNCYTFLIPGASAKEMCCASISPIIPKRFKYSLFSLIVTLFNWKINRTFSLDGFVHFLWVGIPRRLSRVISWRDSEKNLRTQVRQELYVIFTVSTSSQISFFGWTKSSLSRNQEFDTVTWGSFDTNTIPEPGSEKHFKRRQKNEPRTRSPRSRLLRDKKPDASMEYKNAETLKARNLPPLWQWKDHLPFLRLKFQRFWKKIYTTEHYWREGPRSIWTSGALQHLGPFLNFFSFPGVFWSSIWHLWCATNMNFGTYNNEPADDTPADPRLLKHGALQKPKLNVV